MNTLSPSFSLTLRAFSFLITCSIFFYRSWKAGTGPIKDAYNIGENPQFRLEVGPGDGAVWILLTRHITNIQDFKENRKFITVLVYKTEGKRVYYPCEFVTEYCNMLLFFH